MRAHVFSTGIKLTRFFDISVKVAISRFFANTLRTPKRIAIKDNPDKMVMLYLKFPQFHYYNLNISVHHWFSMATKETDCNLN